MNAILGYFVSRLKEPSTWAGFTPILIALGVPAGTLPLVVQIGIAIAGAIAVVVPEAAPTK